MTSENQPTAPESLPNYLADGLPKQDTQTLRDVIEYAEDLIEYQQRPVERDDLPENAEVVEENSTKGWIIKEHVKCGDDTCHCADPDDPGHGPYKYRYWRDNGELQCEYVKDE